MNTPRAVRVEYSPCEHPCLVIRMDNGDCVIPAHIALHSILKAFHITPKDLIGPYPSQAVRNLLRTQAERWLDFEKKATNLSAGEP